MKTTFRNIDKGDKIYLLCKDDNMIEEIEVSKVCRKKTKNKGRYNFIYSKSLTYPLDIYPMWKSYTTSDGTYFPNFIRAKVSQLTRTK